MKYDMDRIRNFALVGASGSGKTSLAELMLYNAGVVNRIGKVEDGNTVMDYDKDEIEKRMSINLSLAKLEWNKTNFNLIDTPGYPDFLGDVIIAIKVTESSIIVVNAVNGIEVDTEKIWQLSEEYKNANVVVINKMDREKANFDNVLDDIEKKFDKIPLPIILPIGTGETFNGIVNVINKKAYIKGKEASIPSDMMDLVDKKHEAVIEAAAESDDALMEKFFEQGTLSEKEIITGLKNTIQQGNILPVIACSAELNIGVKNLMNAISDYLPSPKDKNIIDVIKDGKEIKLETGEDKPKLAYIFKSISEQNLGELAFVRVYSGEIKYGDTVYVPEKNNKERIGQIFKVCGKKRDDMEMIHTGDIGALVKLKTAKSLNTLTDSNESIKIKPVNLPSPVYWQTIKAVKQGDEDKISSALSKLIDEDPTLRTEFNTATSEQILSGLGEVQVNLVKKRLKDRFNVDATLTNPKIPYKETIEGSADVSYRHKKQTGGRGQYGEVYFRIKPKPQGQGFEFVNSIVGGVIPSKFIPAVEKGLKETLEKGIFANYPIVDIQVELYYGSYHDVDSSEMAFKLAASHALKKGFMEAKPILLEPIHKLNVTVPTEFMGDVMSDLSTRRGKILGMEQNGNRQVIKAELPLSELYSYHTSLRSISKGQGSFTQEFAYYQKLPFELAEKVIQESKRDN